MTPPRIVVDARMATDGGIGTYLQHLLPRIANGRPNWRFTCLGDVRKMQALRWPELRNVELRHTSAPIFSARQQVELPLRSGFGSALYWAPNYEVPALLRMPLVVTVHDVNHLALPELLGSRVRRLYARWMLRSSLRRARRVLFDSAFTRDETRRLTGDEGAKGTVVHLGVDEAWHRAREMSTRPLAEPYFLYVGNIKRHKNVPFLLRAFARVQDRLPHRLVLLGRTEGLRVDPGVAPALADLGGRVALLGEVPPEIVMRYTAHAEAFVTASLYEGFGLPALEAMAAGTPCIVSRAGSFPEVCGDAARYADPRDESSFAEAMNELATNPALRALLVKRGRERASRFRWENAAEATAAVLEKAIA